MPLYQYVKARPEIYKPWFWQKAKKSGKLSLFMMFLGSFILIWALWPIIEFSVFTTPLLSKIISPISEVNTGAPSFVLANAQSLRSVDSSTNANTWFPAKPQKKAESPVTTYRLSIPKLNIKNAMVVIGGNDLNTSLIHWGGTGLPGQNGTAIVLGHSTLPQFYNPENYKTIFSTLPTLTRGDEIFINYDGVVYRYVIFDMVITDPDDLSPLEQQLDDSYITLITCVPPGTTWKRLNVKARLVRIAP